MWASLRLLQWIICSQNPKILNARCQVPGVTINSKVLTTPRPINDCFWYRMGSYLAWATYVQDCTFMKYTCCLWERRPRYNRGEKGEMGMLYRPWEGTEKATHNKMYRPNEESQVRKVCKPVCGLSPGSVGYSRPRLKSHRDPWRPFLLPFLVPDPRSLSCPSLAALAPRLLCWPFTELIQHIKVTKDVSNKKKNVCKGAVCCHFTEMTQLT